MTTRMFAMSCAVAYTLKMDYGEFVFCRWFKDFIATGKMVSFPPRENPFYWLASHKIISDLSLLKIKHQPNVTRWLYGLVGKRVLEHKLSDKYIATYRFSKVGKQLFIKNWKGNMDRLKKIEVCAAIAWEKEIKQGRKHTGEKEFRSKYGKTFGMPERE